MQNTKKLLSITNLKKYFPVAKSSIFQRKQLYVRANEDITLDIYEGETLGVVGESGCGKSTLGRVLLQLYPQTAGSTMYYGKSIDEFAPRYIRETLTHTDKYREKINKAQSKLAKLDAQIAGIGEENADFYLLQDRNLAKCEYKTCLDHLVKLIGGFYVCAEKEGTALMLSQYDMLVERNGMQRELHECRLEHDLLTNGENAEKNASKIAKLASRIACLEDRLASIGEKIASVQEKLDSLRASFATNEDFCRYEEMRDAGIDLSRLRYSEMRLLRRDLQIVFQDPYSSLNPRFTIGQIIEEGLLTHNFYKAGSPKMREHIVDTMKKCGLQEYMLHRYPHQFSGGQRQRISIARALAVNPKFVVCDECVSALDVSIQSQIINLLQELKEKEKLTYLFISHDLSVVKYISDRICVMYLGSVVELTDSDTMFADPRHPYTIALLSSIPTTDIESLDKERILLEGNIPSPIRPPSGCKFHTRCYMACDKCKRVPPPLTEVEKGHFVACHFPERKLGENGEYLFDLPETVKKSKKTSEQ